MVLSINTNVSALTAARNLRINTQDAANSVSRLSSGSRVPQARDDAAALAIGSQLNAEVSALEQAAQNTIQAISLLQIADGALSTVGDVLVRQRALATQSASGQLADSERALLAQEFNNLTLEVDRISANTTFNGTQLLNGGDTVTDVTELNAGGLNAAGITVSFDTAETGADEVFRVDFDAAAAGNGNLTVTNLTNGESQTVEIPNAANLAVGTTQDVDFAAIGVTLTLDDNFNTAASFNQGPTVAAVEDGAQVTGVTATATFEDGVVSGADFAALQAALTTGTNSIDINLSSTTVATEIDIAATAGLEFSFDGINFSATLSAVEAGDSVFVGVAGSGEAFANVNIAAFTSTTTAAASDTSINVSLDGLVRGEETAGTTAVSFDFRVGTGTGASDDITVALTATTTASLGTAGLDVGTSASSDIAIDALTNAINTLSANRANIGASQSRLEFAAASIAVAIENTTAAQSGLLDVDVASEITAFTSSQVLVQAGISILSQANQQPNLFLQLLQ